VRGERTPPAPSRSFNSASSSARGLVDPAEQLALVIHAKRGALLRAHRHRLRIEDLEECFSQAALELLAAVRGGRRFAGSVHAANALEQRFVSRVRDRRRALGGRSPLQAALEDALPLGGAGDVEVEIRDARAEVHQLVVRRMELQRVLEVAPGLSIDQRTVLAHQISGVGRTEFCRHFGWSFEKYRKVAQRGRSRLHLLMSPMSISDRASDVPEGPDGSE
jgi:DNA-directed RNA polymerase specialized sigma24 family protein